MNTKANNILSASAMVADKCAPYFAQARSVMAMVVNNEMPHPMAVDKHWRCYYNPAMIDAMPPIEIAYIMLHELRHLLFDHAGRKGNRDHTLWNYAADAELNGQNWPGLKLPANMVGAENTFGMKSGMLAEQYYNCKQLQKPSKDSSATSASGSCADGITRPWELPTEDVPVLTQLEQQAIRVTAAANVKSHAMRGSLPLGLELWAGRVMKPIVPVSSLLHSAITSGLSKSGIGVRSYSRVKRRGMLCIPRHKALCPVVCMVVDTSGSMGRGENSELQRAISLVVGMAHSIATVNVVWIDSKPQLQRNVSSSAQIKCIGGGGTDMRTGVAFADDLQGRDKPDVIVLVTDGKTPWPEAPTKAQLVTVITTEAKGPTYGKVIRAK